MRDHSSLNQKKKPKQIKTLRLVKINDVLIIQDKIIQRNLRILNSLSF